jgi:prevent-host-death family protein
MSKSYSIAEAKNRLPEVVRDVEQNGPIQLTRRGTPVVIMLPVREYERLQKGKVNFWEAYLAFRERYKLDEVDLDPDAIFADVRDRSPGRDVSWE